MSALSYLWTRHRVALIAFGLALALTLFFAVRFVMHWVYWSDPAHRDQQIEGWMTPGYVAHSYDVSPEVIRDSLRALLAQQADALPRGGMTLQQIARATGTDLDQLSAALLAAIAAERARDD